MTRRAWQVDITGVAHVIMDHVLEALVDDILSVSFSALGRLEQMWLSIPSFLPPWAGPQRMVNGRLESSSLDMYIAMEFGSDGDLFNLRWVVHAGCPQGGEPALAHAAGGQKLRAKVYGLPHNPA